MPKFDVTKLNVAIDKLLETTENPGIGFCYRRIAVIVTWRLRAAMRRSLRPT
jgi:hypothetical protein